MSQERTFSVRSWLLYGDQARFYDTEGAKDLALYSLRVAIFGDDRVVGGALEALLRSAGYDARFQAESTLGEAESLLTGANLVICLPSSYTEGCGAYPGSMASLLGTEVPVLKLVTGAGEESCGARSVTWPCSIERLEQEIEATMLADNRD